MRRIRRRREGMTLVELIVSLALMGILMVMVLGMVSPAAKTFARMQRIQFAQLIIDNIEDEIRSQLQKAAGSIKIYAVSDGETVVDKPGSGSGAVLEYVNTDSYVTLISADGCAKTTLMRNGKPTGIITEPVAPGRLLLRYYWQEADTGEAGYQYVYTQENNLVARAVQQAFADKYYMRNYLKLNFAFPKGVNAGQVPGYIEVHVALYRDEERRDLLAEEDFIAELRYKAQRVDDITADNKTALAE